MKLLNASLLVLLLITFQHASAQKSAPPSLTQLENWVDAKSYTAFSLQIRKLGYIFTKKDTIYEDNTSNIAFFSFTYERKVSLNKEQTTQDKIFYRLQPKTHNASVQFTSLVNDLVTYYNDAIKIKFKPIDCTVQDEEDETSFCYQSGKYKIRLIDERKIVSDLTVNLYTIVLSPK